MSTPALKWDVYQGRHILSLRANTAREACAHFLARLGEFAEPGLVTVMACPDDNDDIKTYRFKIERIDQ